MHRRLPPLQLLPAFEAAARLQSMSRAARELNLTASAISQQIKQLESVMEVALFHRLARRIELTEAGQMFFKVATRTLRTYRQGHEEMHQRFGRPVLRISCVPSMAHLVILPALASFQEAFPGIDLRLDARMEVVDFEIDPLDAAVRTGAGSWPGLVALPLAPCHGTLVASAALMQRQPVHTLADLRHHVLIHPRLSTGPQDIWDQAAAFLGVPRIERKGELMLDSDLAGLQAAEQGLGVTLGFTPAIHPLLGTGRLVALMPPAPMDIGHYFVFRESAERDPQQWAQLHAVYAWVKARYDALAALPMPAPLGLVVAA